MVKKIIFFMIVSLLIGIMIMNCSSDSNSGPSASLIIKNQSAEYINQISLIPSSGATQGLKLLGPQDSLIPNSQQTFSIPAGAVYTVEVSVGTETTFSIDSVAVSNGDTIIAIFDGSVITIQYQ